MLNFMKGSAIYCILVSLTDTCIAGNDLIEKNDATISNSTILAGELQISSEKKNDQDKSCTIFGVDVRVNKQVAATVAFRYGVVSSDPAWICNYAEHIDDLEKTIPFSYLNWNFTIAESAVFDKNQIVNLKVPDFAGNHNFFCYAVLATEEREELYSGLYYPSEKEPVLCMVEKASDFFKRRVTKSGACSQQ